MAETKPNKGKFAEQLELELLSALFTYVATFIGNKLKKPQQPQQKSPNLENIVNKPKISFEDVKELESLILANLQSSAKSNKTSVTGKNDVFYSLHLSRKKISGKKSGGYLISIQYGESQTGGRLSVSVKENGKEKYFSESTIQKDEKGKIAPYSFKVTYEDRYGEERLTITYRQQLKSYMKQHIESKEDMTNMVPLKWLNILPESTMGGVLGFTYLGENFMGRRADLTGKTARMVDIHESIHTPDEYETRILTSWIMEKARSKYVK
ncbi:hypothetical protein HYV80_00770 [Candidatus Woesearchaeota archaeon]|nr:hypothetical protein [Candidatus Woesearchaeota archaeon]